MILEVKRVKLTWNFMKVNFKTKEVYNLYFHFSLKDPWFLPRHEDHFGKCDIPLYGWLFFYFGRQTEGILYETQNDDAIIKDKHGKKYYMFSIKNRQMKDDIRRAIKQHAEFHITRQLMKNDKTELTLHVDV